MRPAPPRLEVPDAARRDELATFCGRVVRLDLTAPVRLRTVGERVEVWAATPFDVLVMREVPGTVVPGDVTVTGSDLLAALSVVGSASLEVGMRCDERWRAPLPASGSWSPVGEVPVAEAEDVTARGLAAGEGLPVGRLPAALLDDVALRVGTAASDGAGGEVRVPMRCLLALAGLGLLATGDGAAGVLTVSTGGSPGHDWLRVDVRGGAVVRRRRPALVLQPV